jgi:hypothetical protein
MIVSPLIACNESIGSGWLVIGLQPAQKICGGMTPVKKLPVAQQIYRRFALDSSHVGTEVRSKTTRQVAPEATLARKIAKISPPVEEQQTEKDDRH